MWQRQLTAILATALAACSQVLGVNDVTTDDGGSNNSHYEGTHYGYVIDRVFVPVIQSQVQQYGLDLGSATSSNLDGVADNSLGTTLAIIASQNIAIQQKINSLTDRGNLINLIDLQTSNFVNANNVGLTIKPGQNPIPPACNSSSDDTCRHHLTGTGTFSVSFNSPAESTFGSTIANNTLNGKANTVTVQITLDGDTLYNLDLVHARILATPIFESGIMTATIAGLITKSDLINKIAPAIQNQFKSLISSDCFIFEPRSPPGCNCETNSAGANIIKTFDGDITNGNDRDCQISTAEILEYATLDSCSKDSCTMADSISVGFKIEAVKAVFPL